MKFYSDAGKFGT